MAWQTTAPVGSSSVKTNRNILQQNTSYIETTMGNSIVGTNTTSTRDHFWNVGSDEDGRHRFIQSPGFTVGGNAADPVIGTGMGGVIYLKTTNTRVEGFYRNSSGVYQFIPSFKSGTVAISSTSTFVTITDVPANVYGEIYIWQDTTREIQQGVFMSTGTVVEGFSLRQKQVGTSDDYFVELLNESGAVDLNLKVRRGSGPNATYNYRLIYRAI